VVRQSKVLVIEGRSEATETSIISRLERVEQVGRV